MTMSEKIKKLRLENNMTLEEVGNAVGVGKSTVRKWETGQIANMRRDKIAKLAVALNVSPAYLMGWEDEENKPISSSKQAYINHIIDMDDETFSRYAQLLELFEAQQKQGND